MKTIVAITIMAILATGAIAPALQEAYAAKADNSQKLSPKSFGEKTKDKMKSLDVKTHKTGFESVKKEEAKNYKKTAAEYQAKNIMKNVYRLG